MAQTRVGPADDSRRMKRSISKPEEVSHKDLLVGGVLFRVPAEFVITSQRHRKAIDPSTFLGPTMLSRRSRACSSGDLYSYTSSGQSTTSPHHRTSTPDGGNLTRGRSSLPTVQELRDFSSSLDAHLCPVCGALNCTCEAAAKAAPGATLTRRSASVSSGLNFLTPREQAMHGRYLIRESFANGQYGQVHNGEGMVSHDSVVVKVIPKHILRSPDEKQSVIREQVIHKSCRHPHIIRLIDTYQDDEAHYLILERAANGSMEHRIGHMGIPEDDAKNVFRQLLLALEYLHANCIVHHDLKPHNLLLDASGQLKVCDFGAARAYNKHERGLPFSGIYGTVGYIAPELLQSTPVYTTAVDMFSAGLILFEMLFAYAAFYPPSACMRDEVEFPMPRPSQRHKSQVSTQAKDLIQALLQKDPAMRATAAAALRHPWFHTKNA
ncbi:serine/threonine protein kinase [Aphanomyces invadans]|uniref:Serine/threonine protein kinase n=1 Tax=Aphanomyces invadans TaxID=157072 RepID=A0A024UQZ4_9STRA|nr:serine/threonine protein kinase [Aphanomyces invadans]ETW08028.1 serine/threonine protein kinase [Aphanomyces invadans]|eukprot:XP_008864121.1 serine/threonine protein kinase [Aphanomyces invadans]